MTHHEQIHQACSTCQTPLTPDWLFASIAQQRLYHYRNETCVREYTTSTSRRPPSCVQDSLGTPTGLHFVDEKIGQGAPLGMVFKGRVPIGKCVHELSAEENRKNLVTTRILWLRGLEPGKNAGTGCDTHDRYIYIHGTNHEELLGTPDSHGCLLMANHEVVELFNAIPSGSLVLIGDAPGAGL